VHEESLHLLLYRTLLNKNTRNLLDRKKTKLFLELPTATTAYFIATAHQFKTTAYFCKNVNLRHSNITVKLITVSLTEL